MFKFLKEKIKQAVNRIVHRVETEVPAKEELSSEETLERKPQKEESFLRQDFEQELTRKKEEFLPSI